MLPNEDYVRLKVKETIQAGIKAQRIHRELFASKREKSSQAAGTHYSRLSILMVVFTLSLFGLIAALSVF